MTDMKIHMSIDCKNNSFNTKDLKFNKGRINLLEQFHILRTGSIILL